MTLSEVQIMLEVEVKLSAEYDHNVSCSMTFHTIVADVKGPDNEVACFFLCEHCLSMQLHSDGKLRHGRYVYLGYGYRNMIRLLRIAGVPLKSINVDGRSAEDFMAEFFPKEKV